jgi:hypothetical protein
VSLLQGWWAIQKTDAMFIESLLERKFDGGDAHHTFVQHINFEGHRPPVGNNNKLFVSATLCKLCVSATSCKSEFNPSKSGHDMKHRRDRSPFVPKL